MIVSAEGSDYKPVPAGSYIANCVRVIDLGTQTSSYQGQEKAQRKVLISWEVPEVVVEDRDGQPMPALISSSFTASLHEKASLRKTLESWRGRAFSLDELRGFDLKNVLGAPCMVNIVHTDKDGRTYANVAAVMALPKGTPKPEATHTLINFDLDAFSQGVFQALSPKLQEKIAGTPEYRKATSPEPSQEEVHQTDPFDDEIPF